MDISLYVVAVSTANQQMYSKRLMMKPDIIPRLREVQSQKPCLLSRWVPAKGVGNNYDLLKMKVSVVCVTGPISVDTPNG